MEVSNNFVCIETIPGRRIECRKYILKKEGDYIYGLSYLIEKRRLIYGETVVLNFRITKERFSLPEEYLDMRILVEYDKIWRYAKFSAKYFLKQGNSLEIEISGSLDKYLDLLSNIDEVIKNRDEKTLDKIIREIVIPKILELNISTSLLSIFRFKDDKNNL